MAAHTGERLISQAESLALSAQGPDPVRGPGGGGTGPRPPGQASSPPAESSVSQQRSMELESQCDDLDPEVEAVLSVHLDHHSLSLEMDFL
ncbi:unnamed protein product [Gadus morhua 'NCC']